MDLKNFGMTVNPVELEPLKSTVLSDGEYLVKIEKAEVVEKMTVAYDELERVLKIQYNIESADFTGRKIFENFTVSSPDKTINPKTNTTKEGFGWAMIGDLMRAIGVNTTEVDTWVGKLLYVKGRQNGDYWNVKSKRAHAGAPVSSKPSFFS